jgi:hypothetical protein
VTKNDKELICEQEGHDWDTYTVSTGYWSYDIEQAGYCLRCGEDTHGDYHKLLEHFKEGASK